MGVGAASANREPWKQRLYIPNYRVVEAARYVRVSSQTVLNWQSGDSGQSAISHRKDGAALSYMQLIELAVVAAFREAGVKLAKIREAREWLKKQVHSEYPFADYKFKTDGKKLLMDYEQIDAKKGKGKLVELNQGGQLAWATILDAKLKEFKYDRNARVVAQWHLAGPSSPILIDPRLSFGSPTVKGIPTWALKARYIAGETVEEICDDFNLKDEFVWQALEFEGINPTGASRAWVN